MLPVLVVLVVVVVVLPAGPAEDGSVGADGRSRDDRGEGVVAGEVDLHARPGGAERRPAVVRRARRAVARGAALPIVRVVSPLAPGEEVGAARGLSRGSGRGE